MPRAKPPRKRHGLERWQGQEASQQYAAGALTDEELARTIPEVLQPTLCGFAGRRLGSERATVFLAAVARVLALLPGLTEALAPGAATVVAALLRVEGLAHQFREALGNLDPRSRALLERQYAGSTPKLDLVQARKLLLTLEGRAHDAIRKLRGEGRDRPALRAAESIAVQLGKAFSDPEQGAAPGHRSAGNRLAFVGAALQAAGIKYSDSELRRLLATRRSAKVPLKVRQHVP